MTLYVFKFLFVVCLLLSLALLWRLDWFPVLAPWEIRSKRERDWGRSPFMFLAIPTSRRWGEGLLHDCVFPGLRTDLPSGMPLQGREKNESLREPGDQIEELFRDLRRK